uniref:Histidine--tRNA ligase, chloroplastic n=1 Tax=Helminthora furcellata TaxID=1884666 RepID=A0A1G4NRP1_9FLOR|nr:Histidine-tRNA ligase [Helminthora furcellata]SCW21236.1 Histidine-tRNA ligase [Helminthora furcellata]SCW24096.1 Histidine-tRNA ligase [Helminthora furcellata]
MQSIRGMHDILPEEMKYWQYIYDKVFHTLDSANYQEIRTPIVESKSLFERSIGQDTDIINKEMYTLMDQGNRELTLRPEGTAGLARAIIQHKLCENSTMQKLWYLGPMFRYERPQKGRQRQFHQLGLECYGNNHPAIDAEVISLANNILADLGCNKLSIEINSIGSNHERAIYEQKLKEYLIKYINDLDNEYGQKIIRNPLRILDSKNPQIHKIVENAPRITNYLDIESKNHFEEVQEYLSILDVPFNLNHNLVRGLDYYNNTVFEIKTQLLGSQDTVCGGGRYNNLTQQLGGQQIDAIGWGIGLERLLILMQKNIILDKQVNCIYIATPNLVHVEYSLRILKLIKPHHLKYELDVSGSSLKKQLQKANRKNTMILIIVGEEEVRQQTVTIKWLNLHLQQTCSLTSFSSLIPKITLEYQNLLKHNQKYSAKQYPLVDISQKSSDNGAVE